MTSLLLGLALAVLSGDPNTTARTVAYHDSDVLPIATQIRYTTVIELPKEESVVEASCGDKDFLAINWSGNVVYVKPAKIGENTNVNLLATSGTVYSFLVKEISQVAGAHADLKVFITSSDTAGVLANNNQPKYVPAAAVTGLENTVKDLRAQLQRASTEQRTVATHAAAKAITQIKHDYSWDEGSKAAKAFGVKAIYEDGTRTYIAVDTQTAPALYERDDAGKDSLIQYTLVNGVYTVPKVLSAGYLRAGKMKLEFRRES